MNKEDSSLKGRDCLHPNLERVSDSLHNEALKNLSLKAVVFFPNLMKRSFLLQLLLYILMSNGMYADAPSSFEEIKGACMSNAGVAKSLSVIATLFILGLSSLGLWLHSLFTINLDTMMPETFLDDIRKLLIQKRFEKALLRCSCDRTFSALLLTRGIESRKLGLKQMLGAMEVERRRHHQCLNERVRFFCYIARLAPVVGVLGSLLAFYFSFDQLISSTTTLFSCTLCLLPTLLGMIIALLSTIFFVILKNRILNVLNTISNETVTLIRFADTDFYPRSNQL